MLPGERKQVTVLFCDLVNSTALTERLGPERMRDLVGTFLEASLTEVHHYGGTVPQFTGDGFMALFGAPLTLEDHVRRALLAALAIQRSASGDADLPLNGREQLAISIAIHSGVAVFGALTASSTMEPTVIGDVVNVAARLTHLAEPGTILITEDTWRLARGSARAAPIGPLIIKGKSEPIAAYRLLGYSDRQAEVDALTSSGINDFVDREGELATLNHLARRAADGDGRVVGLVGEPGMGKSRLLAEFRRSLNLSWGINIDWVDASCFPYSNEMPYQLVIDLLRRQYGIVDVDSSDVISSKIRTGLRRARMDVDANAEVLLRLLGIRELGGPEDVADNSVQKARTFEILRRLQFAGKGHRLLILALEDLQWIDKISEEYLRSLTEVLPGAGILVVTTYRPEYRPPWRETPLAEEIVLPPLSAADSTRLVHAILGTGHQAAPLIEAVVAKGDGIPLFLEQLALHAGEAKELRADLIVPNTIHDVLMARIDRLPEQTKHLLQIAAVIGREFSLRLLRAVWQEAGPLDDRLHELARLDFVYERVETEGSVYVFRHALTQEAAYGTLLERNRRIYHGLVGRALEELYCGRAEEVAELLALHFGRSDEAEKAVDYAILAGDKARRPRTNHEALAYFEAALSRLDDMVDTEANQLRRADAVLKRAVLLVRQMRDEPDLSIMDTIAARLPEAGGGFLPEAQWIYQMVADLAQQQRRLDTMARPLFREPLTLALRMGIEHFGNEISGVHDALGSELRAAAQRWLTIADRQWREVHAIVTRTPTPQVFRAGDPVDRNQEAFVPRLGVIGDLASELMLATGCPGLVLYGRRRTGKSTTLKNLDGFLPNEIHIATISMQNPRAFTSITSFGRLIAAAVAQPWPDEASMTVPTSLPAIFGALDRANRRLHDENRRLLLAIDEYENLDEKIGAGVFPIDLLATLRESIQTHRRVTWIFAGSHNIAELRYAPWTSYLVSARTVEMSLFSERETRLLLTEPLRHSSLWSEGDSRRPRLSRW
jgi:class 3 adenylate cyclase